MDELGKWSFLDVLAADLTELVANPVIPYEATLGQYMTVEEAAARYANLQAFYNEYGHFYANCGPYILLKCTQLSRPSC